jgi:hypothetical protein
VAHLLGVKVNVPFSATVTLMVAAETQAARPKKAETAVKRMSQTDGEKERSQEMGRKINGQSLGDVGYVWRTSGNATYAASGIFRKR